MSQSCLKVVFLFISGDVFFFKQNSLDLLVMISTNLLLFHEDPETEGTTPGKANDFAPSLLLAFFVAATLAY